MDSLTLKQSLSLGHLSQTQNTETIQRRRSLSQYIQKMESTVFNGEPALVDEVRKVLGWDDFTMNRFIHSSLITQSSPHASMNVFAPNFAHPWIHSSIIENSGVLNSIHLRTMVTHNNLGDLKYRPYAWWHRDQKGNILQTSLFSRSHSMRKNILLTQAVPVISDDICSEMDRAALRLARTATNYGYFCMIYRAALEHLSNLQLPGEHIDVPLNIINDWSSKEFKLNNWSEYFGEPRKVSDKSELRIASNYMNFALVYTLGISVISGGKKMAAYTPEMHSIISSFFFSEKITTRLPELLTITQIPWDAFCEFEQETSFAVICNDLGASLRKKLDHLLEMPISNFNNMYELGEAYAQN